MKWQIFCSIFILVISSSLAIPFEFRFNLISNGDGKVHLIDARPDFEEIENLFDAQSDIRFLLYTRLNPSLAQEITTTRDSIVNSNFNPRHPVRILIHGYNSNPNVAFITASVNAYLQRDQYNVIV